MHVRASITSNQQTLSTIVSAVGKWSQLGSVQFCTCLMFILYSKYLNVSPYSAMHVYLQKSHHCRGTQTSPSLYANIFLSLLQNRPFFILIFLVPKLDRDYILHYHAKGLVVWPNHIFLLKGISGGIQLDDDISATGHLGRPSLCPLGNCNVFLSLLSVTCIYRFIDSQTTDVANQSSEFSREICPLATVKAQIGNSFLVAMTTPP